MILLKTLKVESCQLFTYKDFYSLIQTEQDIWDCNFPQYFKHEAESLSKNNVLDQVEDGQKFLCCLRSESNNKGYNTIAQKQGDNLKFADNGTDFNVKDGAVVALTAWIPSYPPAGTMPQDGALYTSDGILKLQDQELISCINGELATIKLSDISDWLSNTKADKSPQYKHVRVQKSRGRPKRVAQGTIIFNSVTDKLEVYTKDGWKGLKYEDS